MIRIPLSLYLAQSRWLAMCWRASVCLLCLFCLNSCDRQPTDLRLAEGRPFPALTLNNARGNALSSTAFQEKLIVLNVWATWCPPCRREMPSLERLSKKLDPQRFAVVGMSTDADERLAAEFLLQNGITFTNFFDLNGKLAKQWGLNVYPETFIIAPDRTLVHRIVGLREWDSADMLAQLEAAYQRRSYKTDVHN